MDRNEQNWDEVLIKKEADAIKQEDKVRQEDEIKKKLAEEMENQKSITEYYLEIMNGFVEINHVHFNITRQQYFNDDIFIPMIDEDIERIEHKEGFLLIDYKQLEISLNMFYTTEIMVDMPHDAYQEAVANQAKQTGTMYEPVESGVIVSGNHTLIFSSAITESEIGYLFNLSFYGVTKQSSLAGGFTCRLRDQYSYQNLFKAMIQSFYKVEAEE